MLGLGRALGETMAVTFVIGNAHKISASLLAPGTTISATIANEFTEAVGDLYTSSLIALGLILFVITFIVLTIARLHARCASRSGSASTMAHSMNSSLYAARRRNNAIAKVLALAATAVRPRLAGADPRRSVVERFRRTVACGVHRNDAASRTGGRPAQSDHGQPGPDGARGRHRHADRHPRRHVSRRVRPSREDLQRHPLHQRHPAQRAVDRDRAVHLRDHGRADGPFLRLCRCGRARRHRDPGRRAHHRGHADPGARTRCAKRRRRSACRAPT